MARSQIQLGTAPASSGSSFRWAKESSPSSSPGDLLAAPLRQRDTWLGRAPAEEGKSDLAAHELELQRRIATGRGSLPVLPRAASVAMRLASDPDAPFDELDGLLRRDPPLAARLLSVANTASFRRGAAITTTRSAIGRLGLTRTRDLLFQAVYASSSAGLSRYQGEVAMSVQRSVRCATIAELVSRHLSLRIEGAYLIGLLHDIGESRIYRLLESVEVPSDDEATRLVARYHELAGRELAVAWQLPETIASACGAHHDGAAAEVGVRLAFATDVVVCALGAPDTAELEHALGLAPADARELQQAAADEIRQAGV